ncbi:RNA polymerase sigma factor [Acetivibrio clariflavus]|uniref:RNA polymerase sigma factor, sigma-70 family n=1 Tax=Acetivibrio clariflavus (strain DSM 19732 / NBRC 101661 / EBR45) TaxID=720554 RepID=G8LTX5_ACECE|nr:RNA polymerase sigma factor [Acetivibrio clariflavus]AEV67321.1 RNA polymerase sigma factor, sigma-70 family [Acetivibrio clariflavus DSM 19732]
MDPDEILVEKALKGDDDSFRSIVEKYQGLVYAICFNITGHRQEAENLAQETFIQVYRSLSRYEKKGLKSWIGKIATNKAIDWKRKRRMENEGKVVYLEDIGEISTESNSIHEELIKKENARKLLELCNNLPEIYSSVLIKYYIQSKSYNEISKEDGISIKTVESRLYRAKNAIRKQWKEV